MNWKRYIHMYNGTFAGKKTRQQAYESGRSDFFISLLKVLILLNSKICERIIKGSGVDPFFGLGGGGKSLKKPNNFDGSHSIKLGARSPPQIENCVCLIVFLCKM